MDGGTQGIYLVQFVEQANILVIIDAIDYGLEPGEMKLIEGDNVPKFMGGKKMSLHQTGFQEVLMMADMLGHYPEHLLLIGVQPVDLEDFGGGLHEKTRQVMAGYCIGDSNSVFELDDLDGVNNVFMDQLLGDGKVSIQCGGELNARIQESALAGLWRVHYLDEKLQQPISRRQMLLGAFPGGDNK